MSVLKFSKATVPQLDERAGILLLGAPNSGKSKFCTTIPNATILCEESDPYWQENASLENPHFRIEVRTPADIQAAIEEFADSPPGIIALDNIRVVTQPAGQLTPGRPNIRAHEAQQQMLTKVIARLREVARAFVITAYADLGGGSTFRMPRHLQANNFDLVIDMFGGDHAIVRQSRIKAIAPGTTFADFSWATLEALMHV